MSSLAQGSERRHDHRLRLLADAGSALAQPRDAEALLRAIAALAVPALADICTIHVVEGEAGPRLAGLAGGDERLPRRPLPLVQHVLAGGDPVLQREVGDAGYGAFAASAEAAAFVRAARLRSAIAVPIVHGALTLGVLTLLRCGDDATPFERADLIVAQDLGRRTGLVYGGGRVFQRERRVALQFQEAMLPKALPVADGFALDAVYLPGATDLTVGGDWYDAFVLPDGRLVITIGDVLGRGIDAAITMGRLRQAMQSVAFIDPDPAAMLYAGDRTIRLNEPELFATAIAAVYEPATRRLRFASAGHPGPYERRPDGEVIEHLGSGLPLGLREDAAAEVFTLAPPPGAMLVFFTDGLIEATRDLARGEARLRAALRRLALVTDRPARRLTDDVLDGETYDDVCVLTFDTGGGLDVPAAAPPPPRAETPRTAPPPPATPAAARGRWRPALRALLVAALADLTETLGEDEA